MSRKWLQGPESIRDQLLSLSSADRLPAAAVQDVHPYPDISHYGLKRIEPGDAVYNQAAELQAALDAAYAAGVRALWIQQDVYYYGQIANPGVSLYSARDRTTFYITSTNGGDCRIRNMAVEGVTYENLTFKALNTAPDATNNAPEGAICLLFANGKKNRVIGCRFYNLYGGAVLFRSETDPLAANCYLEHIRKDGIHITGTTKNAIVRDCVCYSAGDDPFPVVGYASGTGTLGSPSNTLHLNCHIYGGKFARGFAYVGANGVRNIGCSVNGLVPDDLIPKDGDGVPMPYTAGWGIRCGLLIATENVTVGNPYRTHPNHDIYVEGIVITNCGVNSDYASLQIAGSAALTPSENIVIRNATVKFSARRILSIGSAADASKLRNVQLLDMLLDDNTNINGISGVPGDGGSPGVQIAAVTGLTLTGVLQDVGGNGVDITTAAAGDVKIHLTTSRIGKKPQGGENRIINGGANPPGIKSVDLRIHAVEQPTVTVTTAAYYLRRSMQWRGIFGKVKRLELIEPAANTIAGIATPVASASDSSLGFYQTIDSTGATDTSQTWANPYPVPVMVRALSTSGAITALKIGNPIFDEWTEPNPGKLGGTITVQPGESARVEYASGQRTQVTLQWHPVVF